MLFIAPLISQANKKEYWDLFNPQTDLWVVSDLKAKLFLKEKLLETNTIIQNEPIRRAGEFWCEIFKQAMPTFESQSYLGQWLLAKDFLNKQNLGDWSLRPKAPDTLIKASKQLALFCTHPLAYEVYEEYDQVFPVESFFKNLLKATIDFYHFCVVQKNIPHFFIPQVLFQYFEDFKNLKEVKGKIFFDLSTELLETEKDAIQKLSLYTDVYVMAPQGIDSLNRAYKFISLGVDKFKVIEPKIEFTKKNTLIKTWRCASQASEARCAVEYVGCLIKEKNISPQNICITAHDISVYENILYHDLSWEGVLINRTLTAPANSLQFFRTLNSQLKIIQKDWDWLDLLEAFGNDIDAKSKKMLKPVIRSEQIFIPRLQKQVMDLEKLKPTETISFITFSEIINKILPQNILTDLSFSKLLSILHKIKNASHGQNYEFSVWVKLFQMAVSQQDITYAEADKQGVHVVDFRSIDEINAEYLVVLGLQADSAQKSFAAELGINGINFFKEKGFDFDYPFYEWTESLRWHLKSQYQEIVLSYPTSDNKGSSISPSTLWIDESVKNNKSLDEFNFVNNTNWTQIQKAPFDTSHYSYLSSLKSWTSVKASDFKESLENELFNESKINLKFPIKKMSATAIESYWSCPFKFLASQGFGLADDIELEVEPTPAVKGQILHKCAEVIMQSDHLDHWTTATLTELVNEQAGFQKTATSDVWPSTRTRLVRQLERLVKQEKNWKKLFPLNKTVGIETKIEGYLFWDKENKKLTLSKEQKGFYFSGRIDRIDSGSDQTAVLLDYKDKSSGLTHIKSWDQNGQFQLMLYSEAVAKGLTDIKVKDVVAAFYYSLRNLQREKGFLRKEFNTSGFLPDDLPKNALIDEKSFFTLREDLFLSVGQCLEKIEEGAFTPQPKKESLCDSCSWNKLCRAKHLL